MAKKSAPKPVKVNILEDYIKLTEENRKFLVKLGAVIHVFHTKEGNIDKAGVIEIRPLLKKGNLQTIGSTTGGTYETFIREDEDPIEYKQSFESIINYGIRTGTFYLKKGQEPVKYLYKKSQYKNG